MYFINAFCSNFKRHREICVSWNIYLMGMCCKNFSHMRSPIGGNLYHFDNCIILKPYFPRTPFPRKRIHFKRIRKHF